MEKSRLTGRFFKALSDLHAAGGIANDEAWGRRPADGIDLPAEMSVCYAAWPTSIVFCAGNGDQSPLRHSVRWDRTLGRNLVWLLAVRSADRDEKPCGAFSKLIPSALF